MAEQTLCAICLMQSDDVRVLRMRCCEPPAATIVPISLCSDCLFDRYRPWIQMHPQDPTVPQELVWNKFAVYMYHLMRCH